MLFSWATTKMHLFGFVASFISHSWKIRLFPKPVGKIAITSRPEIRASNASLCFAVVLPSSACQWFRLLTFCCQRFTHQPIVFLRCQANAYFIGSGCAGSLFFLLGLPPSFPASCGFAALSCAWSTEERKRDCSQSIDVPELRYITPVCLYSGC